jgi:hypothetical protein
LGCKKTTNLLSAPSFGTSEIKTKPSAFNLVISAKISSTAKAI